MANIESAKMVDAIHNQHIRLAKAVREKLPDAFHHLEREEANYPHCIGTLFVGVFVHMLYQTTQYHLG